MKKPVVLLLMTMLPLFASAYDIAVENADGVTIYYNYINNGTELSVTRSGSIYIGYSGSVNLPEEVTYMSRTRKVTSIDLGAFEDCRGLTSVTIPNSVTYIGTDAFYGTGWYNSQPNGILYIDDWLIGYKGNQPTGEIIIKNGTKGIASSAFQLCSGLTSVTIPNSVKSIGTQAFDGCSSLTSVTIGNSVTSIGYSAFSNCSGLTSVTIPNSVTSIESNAFNGCSNLTSVIIGNSVTSIGEYAFSGCIGLTSVTIPNSVTSIGFQAFDGCSNLTSVIIGNSVTDIGNYAFEGCSNLTSVIIGNSVTDIGWHAFYNCTGLTSVTFHCPIIGSWFSENTSIKEIIIGEEVTSIVGNAFDGCKGLTSVTFHCPKIGSWFSGKSSIKEIIIGEEVTNIGSYAFSGCSGLTSIDIPNSVTNIGGSAFLNCTGLTAVYISDLNAWCKILFTDLDANPLYYAKHLFIGNEEVTNANIPNSVTSISSRAFAGCAGLTSVTIPNSVIAIGSYAFMGCSNLTSVTIPNSVTSIGNNAFRDCSSLITVKSYIAEPFNVTGLFSEETYRNGTLYVPAGTKDLYIRFDGWREFLKIEEMEDEDPALPKCETPSIFVQNGKIKFQCNTPDAEFTSTLTSSETFTGSGSPARSPPRRPSQAARWCWAMRSPILLRCMPQPQASTSLRRPRLPSPSARQTSTATA